MFILIHTSEDSAFDPDPCAVTVWVEMRVSVAEQRPYAVTMYYFCSESWIGLDSARLTTIINRAFNINSINTYLTFMNILQASLLLPQNSFLFTSTINSN